MSLMPQFDSGNDGLPDDFPGTTEKVRTSTSALGVSATAFAKAMSKAFADATAGGKQLDDVLKQLALRLSGMAVTQAFRPLAGGLSKLIGAMFGNDTETQGKSGRRAPASLSFMETIGGLTPFASGGVIGTPTYFPLSSSALGLAGEAGPEAIMPLMRGPDGRLGVAMNGGGPAPIVTIQITTPDAQSFRRSEAYITGQIARAVARGQRGF